MFFASSIWCILSSNSLRDSFVSSAVFSESFFTVRLWFCFCRHAFAWCPFFPQVLQFAFNAGHPVQVSAKFAWSCSGTFCFWSGIEDLHPLYWFFFDQLFFFCCDRSFGYCILFICLLKRVLLYQVSRFLHFEGFSFIICSRNFLSVIAVM